MLQTADVLSFLMEEVTIRLVISFEDIRIWLVVDAFGAYVLRKMGM